MSEGSSDTATAKEHYDAHRPDVGTVRAIAARHDGVLPNGSLKRVFYEPGRTFVKFYDDDLVWADVHRTAESAQAYADVELASLDRHRQEYVDKGLPVPSQYTRWTIFVA